MTTRTPGEPGTARHSHQSIKARDACPTCGPIARGNRLWDAIYRAIRDNRDGAWMISLRAQIEAEAVAAALPALEARNRELRDALREASPVSVRLAADNPDLPDSWPTTRGTMGWHRKIAGLLRAAETTP